MISLLDIYEMIVAVDTGARMLIEKTSDSCKRVKVLDLYVDSADSGELLRRIEGFAEKREPRHVVTANLQFLQIARTNRRFAEVVNDADLVVADGMPIVWVSKLKGNPIAARVTGHDLFNNCTRLAHEKGYSVFLLGGAPGAAEDAVGRLREMYPGLKVAGTPHGMFSADGVAEREDELIAQIKDFRPDFLFVALGCPKQEYWINRLKETLDVPVSIGIGCTLEIFTDRLNRAPRWMQRAGIEWFFRLQQEPRRLWRRYILEDLPTTIAAAWEAIIERASTSKRRQA